MYVNRVHLAEVRVPLDSLMDMRTLGTRIPLYLSEINNFIVKGPEKVDQQYSGACGGKISFYMPVKRSCFVSLTNPEMFSYLTSFPLINFSLLCFL